MSRRPDHVAAAPPAREGNDRLVANSEGGPWTTYQLRMRSRRSMAHRDDNARRRQIPLARKHVLKPVLLPVDDARGATA